MSKNNPVAVFDSGVGGLSVLRHIRSMLPHEHLVYLGDTAYVPYGGRSQQLIRQRAGALVDHCVRQFHAKAVVVACNTATSAAIHYLRDSFSIPVIGMEPGVKPAIRLSRSGRVGVLATAGTLNSEKFHNLVNRFGEQAQVFTQQCTGLVELIEQGKQAQHETRELLQEYLQPLLLQGVDTLVLGCTHYPFIAPMISELAQGAVDIVDTGSAIAKHLQHTLQDQQLLNNSRHAGRVEMFVSGDVAASKSAFDYFWGEDSCLQHMSLQHEHARDRLQQVV